MFPAQALCSLKTPILIQQSQNELWEAQNQSASIFIWALWWLVHPYCIQKRKLKKSAEAVMKAEEVSCVSENSESKRADESSLIVCRTGLNERHTDVSMTTSGPPCG